MYLTNNHFHFECSDIIQKGLRYVLENKNVSSNDCTALLGIYPEQFCIVIAPTYNGNNSSIYSFCKGSNCNSNYSTAGR